MASSWPRPEGMLFGKIQNTFLFGGGRDPTTGKVFNNHPDAIYQLYMVNFKPEYYYSGWGKVGADNSSKIPLVF